MQQNGKKRYLSFNTYLRELYGRRVQKVVLDAGFTCPNRDGTTGTEGCIYCDALGSGSGDRRSLSVQLEEGIARGRQRYGDAFIMAYFQAFSNTYASPDICREKYSVIRSHDDIVPLAVGTRPDCITPAHMDVLAEFADEYEVWLELGLQSSHDRSLKWIHRGHDVIEFEQAMKLATQYPVKICLHIIFGLPDESHSDMLSTVDYAVRSGAHGIKFHQLYITQSAPLAALYEKKPFPMLTQDTYTDIVCDAITRLPKDMVIQRLVSEDSSGELIVPQWLKDKRGTLAMIDSKLEERNLYQGLNFK